MEMTSLTPEQLRHQYPYRYFGAHIVDGSTIFRVYAPEATRVWLTREGNGWSGDEMQRLPDGVWELSVPEAIPWEHYKYRILNENTYLEAPYDEQRIDPFSPQLSVTYDSQGHRNYNSIVFPPNRFEWSHRHLGSPPQPMSIYELHLGTFWQGGYREIAEKIVEHVGYLSFTHVQIMPPFQTPIHESWGYLVGCPYAISETYGSVDDFKYLVNLCHRHGIGVIVDVPLGFGIQDWDCGLAQYDGTDLYHHDGARGWNNQWRTRIYNQSSPFVRDYLIGICTYIHHELGVDGARIDAVASQIFLDYDRGFWDWPRNNPSKFDSEEWELINGLGGDRHFDNRGYSLSDAVDFDGLRFYRAFHQRIKEVAPEFFTIAEESRRVFRRLACDVDQGGLGFTFAQNMGEMHRIRKYLSIPLEHKKIEHIEIILQDPHEERYINPINTHDECANGKVRLITEIGNHIQIIGLAALCWFRPGAPMLFQGDEFGEEGWFDIHHGIDWRKTGHDAALHHQQLSNNIHDLNWLIKTEPALADHTSGSFDRVGSNNEEKWFAFIRWGSDKRWDSDSPEEHRNDIIFIRNESPHPSPRAVEIYLPCNGEYSVLYNSINERYIGRQGYNDHDPYWSAWAEGHFIHIQLHPFQNLALKLVSPEHA